MSEFFWEKSKKFISLAVVSGLFYCVSANPSPSHNTDDFKNLENCQSVRPDLPIRVDLLTVEEEKYIPEFLTLDSYSPIQAKFKILRAYRIDQGGAILDGLLPGVFGDGSQRLEARAEATLEIVFSPECAVRWQASASAAEQRSSKSNADLMELRNIASQKVKSDLEFRYQYWLKQKETHDAVKGKMNASSQK